MEYVRLGNTGVKVSRICLGCMTYGTSKWREWVLDEDASRPFIERALEHGINFFDTADMYSLGESERVLGSALRELGVPRDEVVIASKVYNPMGPKPNQRGLSRKHIFEAVDASLKRLGMDYLDLYQIHRWDSETPIEETLEALNDLVRLGKVLYIGASSMWTWQFAKARYISAANGWAQFATMQNHYNLIYREEEREMIPFCIDQGVAVIPWSPLARGFLAGNRTRERGAQQGETTRSRTDDYAHSMYYTPEDYTVAERVGEVAAKYGVKNAQIALAWMLHRPGITAPIIGASKMYQLDEAVSALDIRLSDQDMHVLEADYVPHRNLGF
jgi:aryl-alcohol dehydrogenase (NADP+)